MSSTCSNSPVPDAVSETRKKGVRGSKRSVTHLSKAQLARKRANDREAQRNIRKRTKEHIGNLERKVKELEESGYPGSMERVLKRNQDLEAEIERLRAQLPSRVHIPNVTRMSSEVLDELVPPQKLELQWAPSLLTWGNSDNLNAASNSYPSSEATSYTYNSFEDEQSQNLYSYNTGSLWNESAVYGSAVNQIVSKPTQNWTPYQSSYASSSRFSSPVPSQNSNFSDQVTTSSYASPCWQNQPSIYAWQMSTKLKAPQTYIDQNMISTNTSE